MTHKLAKLLDTAESEITERLEQLESACGFPSEDARLLAHTSQRARNQITILGLDPDDTTGPELFHALRARYMSDKDLFEQSAKINMEQDESAQLESLVGYIRKTTAGAQAWAIKSSALKQLLKSQSPIKTKKILGYRSIDSMIRRESAELIIASALELESQNWQQTMLRKLKRVPQSDQEMRQPKIIIMPKAVTMKNSVEVEETIATVKIAPGAEGNNDVLFVALEVLKKLAETSDVKMEKVLPKLHSSFTWWADNIDLIAWIDDQPISFNMVDVSESYNFDRYFERRGHENGAKHLWQSLLNKYQQHEFADVASISQGLGLSSQKLPQQVASEFVMVED